MSRSECHALIYGRPNTHPGESGRPGPTQQAGSLGLGSELQRIEGALLSQEPTLFHLLGAQGPRTEPFLGFVDENSGHPQPSPLLKQTNLALDWELGRAGAFGVGTGAGPRTTLPRNAETQASRRAIDVQ